MAKQAMNINMERQLRKTWIDALKFIAIVAVLIDHACVYEVYTNSRVAMSSYFSVSLFVMLAGVTSFESNNRHQMHPWLSDVKRKVWHNLQPYLLATIFYVIYSYHIFDLRIYFDCLIHFNAAGPFYYVLFYIQLIIISKLLYRLILWTSLKKKCYRYFAIEIVILSFLSAIFIKYTYVLPVIGGGQYLLGGTYLTQYYIGMVFGNYYLKAKWTNRKSILCTLFSFIAICIWVMYIFRYSMSLDEKLQYFGGANPPGITLTVYAFLILMFGWCINEVASRYSIRIIMNIGKELAKLGRYSYYIFLYHILYFRMLYEHGVNEYLKNVGIRCIIYFGGGIVFPIIIYKILHYVQKGIKQSLYDSSENLG